MIKGIGNDIISIERVKGVIDRQGQSFLDRTFSEREQSYCNKHNESTRNYAGRFAAKESVAKALGTGFRDNVNFLDIEIINDEYGKPFVILSEQLKNSLGEITIHVSISHCKEFANAVAIIS